MKIPHLKYSDFSQSLTYILPVIFLFCSLILLGSQPGDLSAVTEDVTITATVGGDGGVGGGGGGGGGGQNDGDSSVTFSGRAYPFSEVIILQDGVEIAQTIAGLDAKFTVTISDLPSGSYTFSVVAEDSEERRSTLFTFPIVVTNNISTTISGIYIAPTITIDKTVVAKGETITILGESAPNAEVTINVNSLVPYFVSTLSDQYGAYLYRFNTSVLDLGSHTTKSLSTLGPEITSYSKTVGFTVGTETVLNTGCPAKGDFTNDCKVNIIDFSILAYWYGRAGAPLELDLSNDGIISLVDFSILAYYWTG